MFAKVLSDKRLPLYQKLRDEFSRSISEGEWSSGELIPAEQELARRSNASVGTVRKAIEHLVSAGMLERFQGRGTFVRRPTFDASPFRFFRLEKDTGERAVPTGRVLSRTATTASALVAEALHLAKAAKVIRLERLRLFDDDPVLTEEIWLPHRRFSNLLKVDARDLGNLLYAEYERRCGIIIASAEETLTIDRANAADVKQLKLGLHDPVITIERVAHDASGIPMEFRKSRGPAQKFRYHVEIR